MIGSSMESFKSDTLIEKSPQQIPVMKVESLSEQKLHDENIKADEIKQVEIKEVQQKKDEEELRKVRQELGMPIQGANEDPERAVLEAKKKGFEVDVGKSFGRLSAELQQFHDDLRLNKFGQVQFPIDDLNTIGRGDSVDFKKATEVFDSLQATFKKDFMPRDDKEKSSIESHNFRRVTDSLDGLKRNMIGMRSKIEKRPLLDNETDVEKASESLRRVIVMTQRKMDDIEEAEAALRRYSKR